MADPLDKQLVEAVLTRPRRRRADLEEAKLASLRPSRAAAQPKTPPERLYPRKNQGIAAGGCDFFPSQINGSVT